MRYFSSLLLALALVVAAPLQAAAAPPAKTLTAADRADLQRVTDYLNGLRVLQGRILQLNPDGGTIGGTLKIERRAGRMGRLRLDYDAPAKSFLVADGNFVHFWDESLQQTSSVPQAGSPAALILDAQIDLNQNMTVTDIVRSNRTLELTVYKTDDPQNGLLTLVFDEPLRLRQWRVLDVQGLETRVTLQNIDTAVSFADGTFTYRPPNFSQQKR